jgi:hypothetical protein
MRFNINIILIIMCMAVVFTACQDDDYTIPQGITQLSNDCIKRTIGPSLVGMDIEFAYAMAIPRDQGHLTAAWVTASIAGAEETYLEHRSFYTHPGGGDIAGGSDVGVVVGIPSVTDGVRTDVVFVADTNAATLRYYYRVPEEARGAEVRFTFHAEASNGKRVSYDMGPYKISNIDYKLDMVIPNNSYLSISDMAVYNADQAAENPNKVDLVYLFRNVSGIQFAHALVAPGADSDLLPDITLPEGVNNSIFFRKDFGSKDQHLARNQYGVFVDDIDLQQINLSNFPNFGLDMRQNSGAWVETADGRYRAYIYVNNVNNATRQMTVSMKRLQISQ